MKTILIILLLFSVSIAADFTFIAADSDTVAIPVGASLFWADSGKVIFDTDTTDADTGRYIIPNWLAFLDTLGGGWDLLDSLYGSHFYKASGLWHIRQSGLDSLGEFARKYVGQGLWDNGADSVRIDLQSNSGLDLKDAGLALDRTDAANYDWTDETHNFDTDGYIAGGAPFYLKDSSNTNRAIINYTETTKDFITFGNSLFPTVIKGGNSTNAIEIDNGITNINQLTLDNDLWPQYIAYDYGLTDLESDDDLDVDTTSIATRKYVDNYGYLTSESDPVYSAWDKSSGISITESQVSDLDHYDYWNVLIDGVQKMQVSDQESVNFEGGTHITISEPTADKLRVDADTSGSGGLASKVWTTNQIAAAGGGDITGVTAGSGLSGGGSSGDVTLSLDGSDNRNYPHTSDTHSWSTSGSITAGGSLESTGGYVKSASGFTLDDSAGTNQLIMNYVETTVDYYVFGSSSHKTVVKGGSSTNAIEIDANGTNINTLTLDNDLDISSYTNLGATSPITLSGDNVGFNYDGSDFNLLYGTHLEIKNGGVDSSELHSNVQNYVKTHSSKMVCSKLTLKEDSGSDLSAELTSVNGGKTLAKVEGITYGTTSGGFKLESLNGYYFYIDGDSLGGNVAVAMVQLQRYASRSAPALSYTPIVTGYVDSNGDIKIEMIDTSGFNDDFYDIVVSNYNELYFYIYYRLE
ncbi:MAG: hypothetical protein JRJ62_04815 [Deltaproteobacteria bacterium]|nr:hypothetical protein [Deltaproteobacteria bacterium]